MMDLYFTVRENEYQPQGIWGMDGDHIGRLRYRKPSQQESLKRYRIEIITLVGAIASLTSPADGFGTTGP